MKVTLKKQGLWAALAAATLVVSGCSSAATTETASTTDAGSTEDASSVATGSSANPRHVCAIGGADAFFAVLKNGADLAGQAVTQAGSKYTWISLPNYDNIGPDMVKLIEQAVAQECTSLAVPVWDAAAEGPALEAATAAGVKVFMYNSGLPTLEDGSIKAYGYYGTDEYLAGVRAGEYFASEGYKNVRCVNTQPGAINWQQRCGGLVDGATGAGIQADQIILPPESFGDAAAITAAVQAELAKDPSIDGFATGSAADADAVDAALKAAGISAATGGWDVSENIINRIKSGETLFAVDQQGWYQGWLAVSQAWMYDQYAILPANPVILTGPSLITADNADAVLTGVAEGYR
ncbi:substrate-binding domain-containing protein [Aquiluna borgnonia]|uniref:Substrate-binding domain-containing protein n=1 Tax=Aquiluna borgnonia TaxID=2499157 RepID=A0A7D4U846_9MICO|nr:substrate-binding domain-containing protein [Aquiluna borgnonia]QKJ25676.1 substrate-binding domain-containing protein [Aquiluna borgnonia]